MYKVALLVSVVLHAGLIYALTGMQFQQIQNSESIKFLKDRSIEISFVQRSLPEENLDNQEIAGSENEIQTDLTLLEESVFQSLAEEITVLNSDSELQEAVLTEAMSTAPISTSTITTDAISIPDEAIISVARLQTTISNISSINKTQVQSQWLEDCWQQQIENSRIRCTNDPLLVTSPSEAGQRLGESIFKGVNRADEQRQVTDRITRSNEVLSTLTSDPLVGELASTRQSINRELSAYLGGNFNDRYWMFVQASQTADPQVGFLRYLGEPTCAEGPCVFEYTDPRGNRNTESEDEETDESKEEFSVKTPVFPFQLYQTFQD